MCLLFSDGRYKEDSIAERREMAATKPKSGDSVREQWAQQRVASTGHAPSRDDAQPRGSHFAKPSPAPSSDAPAQPAAPSLPSPFQQGTSGASGKHARMVLPSISTPMPVVSAPAASSRPAAPAAPAQSGAHAASSPSATPSAPATPAAAHQRKISGVSGEFPKVPLRPARSQAIPYSRYNKRYLQHAERVDLGSVVGSFSTSGIEGAPAYGWAPFLGYGAVSVLASVVWCAVVCLTSTEAPVAGDASLTAGIALLVLIVLGGLGTVAVTTALSLRAYDDLSRADVLASAVGKVALSLLVAVAAWVGAMAFVTYGRL